MTNEVLFAGGRIESVDVLTGSVAPLSTTTLFDTAYADCAIALTSQIAAFRHKIFTDSSGVLTPTTVVAGETLFAHFEIYAALSGVAGADGGGVQLKDSSGFPWIRLSRLITNDPNLLALYVNTGTGASPTWTLLDTSFATSSGLQDFVFDIEVTIGSPHSVKLYFNGNLIRSGTFTNANFTNIAEVHYGNLNRTSSQVNYSQLLTTRGISTIGAKVKTIRPTGAGANTGWTNTYTAVNEVVNNDTTLQNAATAGLKSTHAMGDVSVPSGFEIKTVFHWLRAKNDGTGPTNIKSVLRSGGVDYSTENLSNIGLAYAPVGARYNTDPVGANWTQSVWNAIEAGYEAAT